MVLSRLLPPKNSVLLIDYDNAAGLFPKQQFVQRISNWLAWLKDGKFDPKGRRRKFVEKRVYWHPTNGGQQPAFEHHGFYCETCVYETALKKGMSAVDINLAMDAIDVAHRRKGALQEIIILASDSDYVSLIDRLKKKGIQTCIVVSSRDKSIVSYTGRADLVIPDEKLAEAAEYVNGKKPSAQARAPAPPAAPKPAAAPPVNAASKKAPAAAKPVQNATAAASAATDVSALAARVEEVAQQHSGPVGRDKVMTHLTGKRTFPREGLAGKKTYREFAEAVVALRPQLGMIIYRGGQTVSIYRKRKA
ncbi:NYN domain-containing protein [Terricaulis sp.]|uniref:NYN domain-containing protein n=1 Tax=Terricaulis sp. TaxID=2768686 RepID=UPI003782F3AC